MEKILTVNDVADVLQVKPITVREMFREQRIRGFKVGKAWRTTEQMLEEDIATLARGETPPPMPAATRNNPVAKTNGKKPGRPRNENGSAPRIKDDQQLATPPLQEKERTEKAKSDKSEDDTQGLLF